MGSHQVSLQDKNFDRSYNEIVLGHASRIDALASFPELFFQHFFWLLIVETLEAEWLPGVSQTDSGLCGFRHSGGRRVAKTNLN